MPRDRATVGGRPGATARRGASRDATWRDRSTALGPRAGRSRSWTGLRQRLPPSAAAAGDPVWQRPRTPRQHMAGRGRRPAPVGANCPEHGIPGRSVKTHDRWQRLRSATGPLSWPSPRPSGECGNRGQCWDGLRQGSGRLRPAAPACCTMARHATRARRGPPWAPCVPRGLPWCHCLARAPSGRRMGGSSERGWGRPRREWRMER